MVEKQDHAKINRMAEEIIEAEIERMEKTAGKMTEEAKAKFRKGYFSKVHFQVRLKHWVETEFVPADPDYELANELLMQERARSLASLEGDRTREDSERGTGDPEPDGSTH